MYRPFAGYFAGFGPEDGTVDFYLRVGTLAAPGRTMLDFGAGRAEWFEDETVALRKSLRHMQGRFGTVIATDIDPVVMTNAASDRTVLMEGSRVPLEDHSVDVIVADYVLEHIPDVPAFEAEVDRLLKPGGWLCARTPHKFNYVSLAARALAGPLEDLVMKHAQPERKEEDIFPKHYRLNTMAAIDSRFRGWTNLSYLRRTGPSYYFGSRIAYAVMDFAHRLLPRAFSGNIFVFVQKPGGPAPETGA